MLFNPPEGAYIKYKYVNPDIPSSNTVVSALLGNLKTYFNSSALIPETTANIGGIAEITLGGTVSTGVTALSLTLTIEMQGVIVTSIVQPVGVNLSNSAWNIDIKATILNNGSIEVQGTAQVGGAMIPIKNLASFTMSTAGGVPVTASAQWGTLALGGSIQLRQMIVQVL